MNKKATPWLLIGGGLAGISTILFAGYKSGETKTEVENAIKGPPPGSPPVPGGKLPVVNVRLTGYWPFVEGLDAKERLMEGGKNDRVGNPLYTLEMYQAGKAPYVSVAGDWEIWPYGQRISISAWPNVVFRVVDTGGNFFGAKKVYRVQGLEPLDICVASSKTFVPKKNVTATVHVGDTLGHRTGPKVVQAHRFKDQTVVVGDAARVAAAEAILGAYYATLEQNLLREDDE